MERAAGARHSEAVSGGPGKRNRFARWLKLIAIAGASIIVVGLLGWSLIDIGSDRRGNNAPGNNNGNATPISFLLAGEGLIVPANMIRFPSVRGGGAVESLDLLLHWPSLEGYSKGHAEAFGDSSPLAPLIYVTIEARGTPLDSDGRLAAIYERYFVGDPIKDPSGLIGQRMSGDSAYRGEEIYSNTHGDAEFVTRCLAEATAELPATCIRDVNIGEGLSIFYRFNRFYLGNWRELDSGLKALAKDILKPR
jgi:hypothetical protein